jgi:hypothetical protein
VIVIAHPVVACAEKRDGVYLIQMLLPRTGRDGRPPDDSVFAQKLVDAFEGATAYLRSSAQGAWVATDGASNATTW